MRQPTALRVVTQADAEVAAKRTQQLFIFWSALRPCSPERDRAWHRYCDARDGLPDGASKALAELPHVALGDEISVNSRSTDEALP